MRKIVLICFLTVLFFFESGSFAESREFNLSESEISLNLAVDGEEQADISALNVSSDVSVIWAVSDTDIAIVAPEAGLTTTVKGLQVGQVIVTAMISGDEEVSADCSVTVENVTPASEVAGGGGGCNISSFYPAIFFFVTPLFLTFKN